MIPWTEWFNFTFDYQYLYLIGAVSFGLVFVFSLIYQLIISGKVRNAKVKSNSFLSFRMLFVAITFINFAYLSDHVGNLLGGNVFQGNFSTAISIIGYAIAITALNLFMLRIINFRTNVKKIIKILAYIETILLVFVGGLYLVGSFWNIPSTILDSSILIFGGTVLAASVFTIITLFVEAKSSANQMVKLRLRMAAFGTIGILLDGLANIMHIVFSSFSILDQVYYRIAMPLLAVVFYFISMITYYYSLFPPLWLQQTSGVLPPSFTDLMKKQAELKKIKRTPQ
ncbi:MAG: hypothetical protein ACTSSH_02805 [Candidatus Heimdallarchaeota archaeon]